MHCCFVCEYIGTVHLCKMVQSYMHLLNSMICVAAEYYPHVNISCRTCLFNAQYIYSIEPGSSNWSTDHCTGEEGERVEDVEGNSREKGGHVSTCRHIRSCE